ncbi:MAG: BamA/TamA family outer membrane protein [Chitinophagaceae bacterium]|nr:BamA/TamA family outer membrane protein [Chitinophagaceae bacterium]
MPVIKCAAITCALFTFLLSSFIAKAQTDTVPSQDSSFHNFVRINHILIDGNRRTKRQVILRQITFSEGDTIAFDVLMKKIEESHNQLMNIGLFNEVVLNIKNWEDENIDVAVSVKERWYTFPVPALDLYDRNLNVWLVDHNASLKYLQFGLRFYQQNVRGRDEDLKLVALFGYSQLYQIQYNIPYINRKQNIGLKVTTSFSRTRNLTYGFTNNKDLIYLNVDAYQKTNFYALADVIYQPAFKYKYIFTMSYNDNEVTDTIAKLNPDYFLNGDTRQQYFTLRGLFIRDFRDIASYPLKGNYIEVSFSKIGLGLFDNVNIYSSTAVLDHYVHFGKKWYASTVNKLKISFPKEQPYNLNRGLGYSSDYVHGYEYYIIDGQSFGYTRMDLKNQLLKIKIKTPPKNPFLKGANIPFALYGRVFASAGYVKDDLYYENNPLNNSLLLGGGLGLDLTLIYDTTIRVEYSINKLGEHGFFLHMNSIF